MKNYKLTFGLAIGLVGFLGTGHQALAQQTTLVPEARQIAPDKEDPADSPGPLDSKVYSIGDVSLFPNPAQDHLNVDFGREGGHKEVLIYDLIGNLVKHTESYDQELQISIADLKKGVYILKVEDRAFRFQKI